MRKREALCVGAFILSMVVSSVISDFERRLSGDFGESFRYTGKRHYNASHGDILVTLEEHLICLHISCFVVNVCKAFSIISFKKKTFVRLLTFLRCCTFPNAIC